MYDILNTLRKVIKMDIDMIEISKALSNETRLNILKWLKSPEENFPPQGGCVSSIQAKANLSPSTVSNYLDTLQRAGLLLSERHGKWTYYRRNEETIKALAEFVKEEL